MENNNSIIEVEGILPCFKGFYDTIYEPDYDSFIEEPYDFDDYEWQEDEYFEELSQGITSAVSELINNTLDITVEYEKLVSPQYYNFTNDSIYVKYTLTQDVYEKMIEYLRTNIEGFSKYVRDRYTSRDGFMSWYSNDANYWLDVYLNDQEHKSFGHCFSHALEFIVMNEFEDEDSIDMWIYHHDHVSETYIYGTLTEEAIERHRELGPEDEGYDHSINRNENQLALTFN